MPPEGKRPKSKSATHLRAQSMQPSPKPSHPTASISPSMLYHSNLRVLQRRNPSILSTFDTFAHVCVFHAKPTEDGGVTWSKDGFEGSMFLFERSQYPPYGFYILNRAGKDDFVQIIHPEDELYPMGNLFIYRSFPEYSNERLQRIRQDEAGDSGPFDPCWRFDNVGEIKREDKGECKLMALWIHTTDTRESMNDVMLRLHSFVKANKRYPDEYRFGPDRPPTLALRKASYGITYIQSEDESYVFRPNGKPLKNKKKASLSRTTSLNSFLTKPEHSSAADSTTAEGAPAQAITVDSLFAPLMSVATTQDTPTSSTGLSLLNTFFASATPLEGPTSPPAANGNFEMDSNLGRLSPSVLNQDVINGLLGFKSRRTAGSSSSTSSAGRSVSNRSRRSHPSSREGDDEDEDPSDVSFSEGFSESSTVLDSEEVEGAALGGATPRVNGHTDLEPSSRVVSQRQLVPFSADSELWPYNRSQPSEPGQANGVEEIPELDFREMESFEALTSQASDSSLASRYTNGHSAPANGRSRKARNARREQERQQAARQRIEDSWDFPSPPSRSFIDDSTSSTQPPSQIEVSSPSSSWTRTTGDAQAYLNGSSSSSSVHTNGTAQNGDDVDPDSVRRSLLSVLAARTSAQPKKVPEKKEFMRELLSLIYTDKEFGEQLYTEYCARV